MTPKKAVTPRRKIAPRKKAAPKKRLKTRDIKEALTEEPKKKIIKDAVSTGSTLLNLAISGGILREGGIPGGNIVEIYGPPSVGKTSFLVETAGNAQRKGGDTRFDDPEGRLNKEYSEIFGYEFEDKNYHRPDTVNEMFDNIWNWKTKSNKFINVSCADSLAALSTEMEMKDTDAMGMKRAKDFSERLRKTCRVIANNNWLILCSNQERMTKGAGTTTSGGKGVPYYASLRLRITHDYPTFQITRTKTINGKKITVVIGIRSKIVVKKSSIDKPFRECYISNLFDYGFDDIRENLIFLRDYSKDEKYTFENREFSTIGPAIQFVEDNNLEENIRQDTIELWHEIQELLKTNRKRKIRK